MNTGGLSGPRGRGEIDLCQKQNKPALKRVSISHLPHFKLIFRGAQRKARSVFVLCVRVHVRVHVKNSHTTEELTLTWMSDSLSLSSSTSSTMSRISS